MSVGGVCRFHLNLQPLNRATCYESLHLDTNKFSTSILVGRVSAPRSGGTGLDPGPRHTKVVNNGTSCSPLGTRIGVGRGLVAPVSV